MDSSFIDLDILIMRIREPQSKVYFLEAVKAYRAGALRAALSSTWVAIVYDFISKFRELSNMDDAGATEFVRSWDNATSNNTKKLLELEASILSKATSDIQIIDSIAEKHLNRIREDRHLCAHPAYSDEAKLFEPSSELVRLHLVNAIELVLSQPPLMGKAIFKQFDADVQSSGFSIKQDYFDQKYLKCIRPQYIKNFGIILAKSLLKGIPSSWEEHQEKIVYSLKTIRNRANDNWLNISDEIVKIMNSLEPIHRTRAIVFLVDFPDFWSKLDDTTKSVLTETINNIDLSKDIDYRILACDNIDDFKDGRLNIISLLSPEQLHGAIAVNPHPDLWPKALNLYQDSRTFRGSEDNFTSYILPFSENLSKNDCSDLLRAITTNDQNWAASKTPNSLHNLLISKEPENFLSFQNRNEFFQELPDHYLDKYEDVLTLFEKDGWVRPDKMND